MSYVRKCDRCGNIFSENEEDWSTFTGVKRMRDPKTKQLINEEIQQDACTTCTAKFSTPVKAPAITSTAVED